MSQRAPDMLKPTLIAGLTFGVLGALPFFSLLNCACCALIVGCGLLASYLYSGECRNQRVEFRPGQGALVGLVAGGFYTMGHTLVSAIVRLLVGDRIARMILDWVESIPDLPERNREMMESILERSGSFTVLALVGSSLPHALPRGDLLDPGRTAGRALFKYTPPPPLRHRLRSRRSRAATSGSHRSRHRTDGRPAENASRTKRRTRRPPAIALRESSAIPGWPGGCSVSILRRGRCSQPLRSSTGPSTSAELMPPGAGWST